MKINGVTDIPAGMEYISIDRCGDYEHIEIIRNSGKEINIKTRVETPKANPNSCKFARFTDADI